MITDGYEIYWQWNLQSMPSYEQNLSSDAKSGGEAPIDTDSQAESLPSRKVDIWLNVMFD